MTKSIKLHIISVAIAFALSPSLFATSISDNVNTSPVITAESSTQGQKNAYQSLNEKLIDFHTGLTAFRNNAAKNDTDTNFKSKRYFTVLRNIYWGWNFAYTGNSDIKNCFEVGVGEVIAMNWKPWKSGPDFRIGVGFGMKRFLSGSNMMFDTQNNRLFMTPAPADAKKVKGHWDTWTFHVPLMMSQSIYGDFGFAIGAMINFNTYSKAWAQHRIGDTRYKEVFKGIQQRLLTVEIIGIIGFREGIGVYAKWSPVPLMQSGYGPDIRSWSLGASLNF